MLLHPTNDPQSDLIAPPLTVDEFDQLTQHATELKCIVRPALSYHPFKEEWVYWNVKFIRVDEHGKRNPIN